jgi:hypothetical protein
MGEVDVEIAKIWAALANCKEEQQRQRKAHEKMEYRLTQALERISNKITSMSNDFKVIKWSLTSLVIGLTLGFGLLNWDSLLKILF